MKAAAEELGIEIEVAEPENKEEAAADAEQYSGKYTEQYASKHL